MVTDVHSRWVVNSAGHRVIKTFVTVRVDDQMKGATESTKVLEFLGGTVGHQTMEVGGMPRFTKGQRAWFFIRDNGATLCPLIYAHHGAYLLKRDPISPSDRLYRLNGAPLTSIDAIGQSDDHASTAAVVSGPAMSSADFGQAISRELRELELNQKVQVP